MKLYHAAEANRNGLYQYIETSWQSKIAAKNLLQLVMYMDDSLQLEPIEASDSSDTGSVTPPQSTAHAQRTLS